MGCLLSVFNKVANQENTVHNLNGKEIQKKRRSMYTSGWMVEPYTTLKSNYTPIKVNFLKEKENHGNLLLCMCAIPS